MNEPQPRERPSIYKHMLRGSLWTILMRWSIRAIGLVSVLILARLLTPQDFGIVAMASIVIGFIQGFTELGVSAALIREPDPSRAHCDTAWTIQLMVGTLVGILIAALAEPAAWYFSEPRLVAVLYLLAASALITSSGNVGMALVRKALDFAKDFRFTVYTRLANFIITVTLAFVWRDYWALVAGQVVAGIFAVWLSYRMHPYRPRLSLAKARVYLTFSAYVVPLNVARFVRQRFGALVVGRIAGTTELGYFNVAAELASMATAEVILPVGRAMFPSYVTLLDDKRKLVEVFLNVLAAVSIITIPVGAGLSMVAEEFVFVVLGHQWTSAVPLLQWLAIYGILNAWSFTLTGNILIVTGHERRAVLAIWLNLAILVPCVIAGGWLGGPQGVAQALTLSALVALPLMAYLLTTALPVTLVRLGRAAWPSVAAAVLMLLGLALLTRGRFSIPAVQLAVDVSVGAALYISALFALWHLRGRPNGVERVLVDMLVRRFARSTSK